MKVSISLPDALLEAVDARRQDVPRSVWIRRAIERELGGASERALDTEASKRAARSTSRDSQDLPAPAEQPRGSRPSSADFRRVTQR